MAFGVEVDDGPFVEEAYGVEDEDAFDVEVEVVSWHNSQIH